MSSILNIDDIKLVDILRQLDFYKSLEFLKLRYNLRIEIVNNDGLQLFLSDENFVRNEEDLVKLTISKRRLGLLYFSCDEDEEQKQSLKEYLNIFFQEQMKLGYKIYLTNDVHLKLAEDSYAELDKKNKELVKANDALKELDKVKTNFLAMISHELKTPLTSIIGYSEFLQLEDLSEESEDTVEKILNNALELHALIKQILDITKIEEGAVRLIRKTVNIEQLIASVEESVNYLLSNKRIKLVKELSIQVFNIELDEEKIFQSLRNLITNAIKFSREGGIITLKIEENLRVVEDNNPESETFTFFGAEEEKYLKISVIDQGIGIAEKHQKKLFNSFYQVDGSQTRSHGGTGLGLSIVKNFITAHKGFYGLCSKEGEGSTFWFELPYQV